MGGLVYSSNSNSPKTELAFILLGPENSGKTTALLNLVHPDDQILAVPTSDFNSDTMYYKKYTIHLLDITKAEWYKQSQESLKQIFEERDALLYFIDCTKIKDKSYQFQMKKLLYSFLNVHLNKNFPFIVCVNKNDLNPDVDTEEVVKLLDLYKIKDRRWYIKAVSTKYKIGMKDCLEWLINSLEV
jgi:GTPase SAR1 family protein